jgi:hypothetical protein
MRFELEVVEGCADILWGIVAPSSGPFGVPRLLITTVARNSNDITDTNKYLDEKILITLR